MHREHRRLVDREHVVVLVEHRNVARNGRLVPRWPPEEDLLLGADAVIGLELASLGIVRARANDRLGARAAGTPELAMDEHVEAMPGDLGWHPKHRGHGVLGDARGSDEGCVGGAYAGHPCRAIVDDGGGARKLW